MNIILMIDAKRTNDTNNRKGKSLNKVGQHEEAINCYDKALEIDHKNANLWNSKGWSLGELGRYEEAMECYNKALSIDPNYQEALDNKRSAVSKYTQVLYDRGDDLKRSGRYEEAINSYNRVLELAPEYLDAWYHKGLSLSNLKKYQEAIECFDRIIEMNPNHADAWNNKGISLGLLGNYQEAIECFDRTIKIDPAHSTARDNRDSLLKYVSKPNEPNSHTYEGMSIDLTELTHEIVLYFQRQGFKVEFSRRTTDQFNIQAMKAGIARTVAGFRRSAKIIITGNPQKFQIKLATEAKKNLAVAVPLTIATIGFYVPVAGATMTSDKKFKDDFWEFVNNEIHALSAR